MARILLPQRKQLRKTWPVKKTGQALLEFALVLPVLLMLLFGTIDLGWMVFNYSQLYNGLREATRYGSVAGFTTPKQMQDCQEIRNRIAAYAGLSGVKATEAYIKIWYDDGRAVPITAMGTDTSGTPAKLATNVVGTCGDAGFLFNTGSYACLNPSTATCPKRDTPPDLLNGDRIVIDVQVTVPFLTPILKGFVPNGIVMHLRDSRSVFPDGLAS